MKCGHEAWEESAHSRKCADCGEWLEPTVKPTADFQVGDRVSVEGVVTDVVNDAELPVFIRLNNAGIWQDPGSITLIERPRRKLRVGSVWERRLTQDSELFDRYVWTGVKFVSPNGDNYSREGRDIDTHPHHWREVPVEELEREAGS